MRDDDVIDLGSRKIKAIHTPGHCCFYEEDRKYLYAGDLIYSGCLDAFYPTTDPFAFMLSVNNIKNLYIKKILPAHHQINLRADLIDDIASAFNELHCQNKLHQGNGIFEFGDFQIHI